MPFCKQRCIYCAFYSTTRTGLRQRYVDAVCKEMELRGREEACTEPIETVYLGGGTPSQLSVPQLQQLLQHVRQTYGNTAVELTIEVNPDDVTPELARALPPMGINRVSMGVQTFDDDRLRFLHRRHTSGQVFQAVDLLRDAGTDNISIDLMYGFPGESLSDWEHDIDTALGRLRPQHISAYCLTVEEGTPLYKILHEKNHATAAYAAAAYQRDETERQMYELLIDRLLPAGYEHYEISNFALPGYRSRHNGSYWDDTPYIGLGAAAHSYSHSERSWNVADVEGYISTIERGQLPQESEQIDADTHYNDLVTVALRTSHGLYLGALSERHRQYCLREARPYIESGLLRIAADHLILTRSGLFVSDYVMSGLIYLSQIGR